jgi:hypothetical protein
VSSEVQERVPLRRTTFITDLAARAVMNQLLIDYAQRWPAEWHFAQDVLTSDVIGKLLSHPFGDDSRIQSRLIILSFEYGRSRRPPIADNDDTAALISRYLFFNPSVRPAVLLRNDDASHDDIICRTLILAYITNGTNSQAALRIRFTVHKVIAKGETAMLEWCENTSWECTLMLGDLLPRVRGV